MPRNPRRSRLLALLLLLLAATSYGAECLKSAAGAGPEGAPLRSEPRSDSSTLGRLGPGESLPLIAIMNRWYETRTAAGESAFVSKQSADVIDCSAGPVAPAVAATGYELHAIDVGTGLSVFVRGADFSLMFDAGTNDDLARGTNNRIVAYLRTLTPQVTRINHLLLSHPHRDHVELMPDLFQSYEIQNVWDSGAYNDICAYRLFLAAIAVEPGVHYHTALRDAGLDNVVVKKKTCYGKSDPARTIEVPHDARIDDAPIPLGAGASMRILYADGTKRPSYNENSLVVRLELGPHKVLFMGDAEAGGRKLPTEPASAKSIEGKLLACCADLLKADVLIVGHHGSKTSSRGSFIQAVGAKIFIISAGPTLYGSVTLPDAEIVSELEAVNGGQVFRTDLDDDQCELADKVGPDNDGKAGGCHNVLLTLPTDGAISSEYVLIAD